MPAVLRGLLGAPLDIHPVLLEPQLVLVWAALRQQVVVRRSRISLAQYFLAAPQQQLELSATAGNGASYNPGSCGTNISATGWATGGVGGCDTTSTNNMGGGGGGGGYYGGGGGGDPATYV